ncbi:MAG: carbon storage regulator [Thiotrichales bacterium]|nr:carbon storage regulator [Thiotrichales bacterium]
MLVLTRKEGEVLVIDGQIKVTILSVKGSQVRVGIEAPQSIPIHRQELLTSPTKTPSAPDDAEETPSPANLPQA